MKITIEIKIEDEKNIEIKIKDDKKEEEDLYRPVKTSVPCGW